MNQSDEIEYDDLYYDSDIFLWDDKPYSGVTIDRFPDGQLCCEVHFLNGHEHGVARSWHSNGQLQGETFYVNGRKEGIERDFYWDGSLCREAELEFGVLMRETKYDFCGTIIETYKRPPGDFLYQKVLELRAKHQQE